MNDWIAISEAPKDGTVLRVKIEDHINSHEYYSFFDERHCSGPCASCQDREKYRLEYGKQAPEHIFHTHSEWLICDGFGEELHPLDGRKNIYPTHWRPFKNQCREAE